MVAKVAARKSRNQNPAKAMNDWLYLCLKRDIPEGKYKTFDVFGRSVVAKNDGGKIVVARNACEHRGFRVCHGSGDATKIKCPYHGLLYNFKDQDLVHETNGAVFFGRATPDKPKPDFKPVLGDEFGFYSQVVNAPFHLWMQNTADPNHLNTVHADSFDRLFDGVTPYQVFIEDNYSQYVMPLKDEVVLKYRRYFKKDVWHERGFMHMLHYPHLSVTSFLGVFFSVETATPHPIDDNCTQVYTRFFVAPDSGVPALLKRMAMDNNMKILQEDKAVVEQWAQHYRNDAGHWLQGEERIKHFVEYFERSGLCSHL